jgi:hypothetical protein
MGSTPLLNVGTRGTEAARAIEGKKQPDLAI